MRFGAVIAVVLGAGGVPVNYYGLPPWLYLAVTILGSGAVGKVVWDRNQRKLEQRLTQLAGDKTRAERDHIYQEIAQRTGAQFEALQARYDELSAKYDSARSELQTYEAKLAAAHAERDRIVSVLRAEMRDLEEQLATTRAQAGLDERRGRTT